VSRWLSTLHRELAYYASRSEWRQYHDKPGCRNDASRCASLADSITREHARLFLAFVSWASLV
jgi:cation transport regulator ChaB